MMDSFIKESLNEYINKYYIDDVEDALVFEESDSEVLKSPKDLENILGKDAFSLNELVENVGETFHEYLFKRLDERDMKDADFYKKANIDRKLFSKIRSNPAYHPSKNTVLAFAVALELSIDETNKFLSKAEYAFSTSNKGDLIVKFFIEKGIYDIDTINVALYEYGQPLLGIDPYK